MKFYIQTFGCKVNLYESDWLTQQLEKTGWEYSEDLEQCDVIIVNSCTVTAQGDSRSVHALKSFRKKYPSAVLVITGCFPQTHKAEIENIDADVITGTVNRKHIPELINTFLNRHEKIIAVEDIKSDDAFEDMECSEFTGHTRAFIKIQDGCNQFCSYCAIPYARGRCRSKNPETLRHELKICAENGYKEAVLSGINLAFWGTEWNMTLADAVQIAADTDGIERIRLGSLEPERITQHDLETFAGTEKFCPQFHLSLQSGCDETLKRMNRKYDTEYYSSLVDKIRKVFPDAAITTDIMVGFPGETDEEFEKSRKFVEKIGFAKVHVFRYSPRSGTRACNMKNQLNGNIKKMRAELMGETVQNTQKKFLSGMCGKTVKVLFEHDNEAFFHHGHAENGTVIKISSKNLKKDLHNRIFCVKIDSSDDNFCYGKILD